MRFPVVGVPCTAARRRRHHVNAGSGINPLSGYCCAVRSNLIHKVSDLTSIETHGHHSISTDLMSRKPQPLNGLESAVGQKFGVALHLTTEHGAEARTYVGEGIACPNCDAEDLSMHSGDSIARKVIRRHHHDRRSAVDRWNSTDLTRVLLGDRCLDLIGPSLSIPPSKLGRVLWIGVPACRWSSPVVLSHESIVRPGSPA